MTSQTRTRQLPGSAALFALLVASPFAVAFAQDAPLARTAGDAALKWGGCPDFMPKSCEIAVLHGDPAKNNADVFFKVPANAVIPRHWHTSAERMVLVAGELHVTYDGHATAVLKPGSYAYGPAKLSHKAECSEAGPCVLFIAFESPVDAVASDARK
ncbi:cupin domain-containing protein [Thiobacillus denitrificans]|uniref:Cupin n=1 Tax=Thiobacillus denitrificans TaxID=36861 RepID=A0A125BCL0_THIDE|nr:cupin domain-containing protein [Thiobacillus denitrificans]KVW95839.1 cupin [Thiobacillus denitrificans]